MSKLIYTALIVAFMFLSVALPTHAATASFSQNLGYGAQGQAVVMLQQFLMDKGFLKIGTPTGKYLDLTRNAVKSFQLSNGIEATGFFGQLSIAAANNSGSQVASSPTPSPKSSVSVVSITSNSNTASVGAAGSKTISWKTDSYPAGTGVNVNLISKVSNSPTAYKLVRQIAVDAPNNGKINWKPTSAEIASKDNYIEVTCSTSLQFKDGCQVTVEPMQTL